MSQGHLLYLLAGSISYAINWRLFYPVSKFPFIKKLIKYCFKTAGYNFNGLSKHSYLQTKKISSWVSLWKTQVGTF